MEKSQQELIAPELKGDGLEAARQLPANGYRRYHIDTRPAADIVRWPSRFTVKINRLGLAKLLLRELIQYRGDLDVVLSRPCVYGVFSGPVGGFLPREDKCVGCLRCTTQYPEFVQIGHNPARERLGDSYFTHHYVNAIAFEASTGSIPVKGAGYRGRFGGDGWDGMWTDMSEIVRPTRDGIHGREFISTVVDIGRKPDFLAFDSGRQVNGNKPQTFGVPLPTLLDVPPAALASETLCRIFNDAAASLESLAILPLSRVISLGLSGPHVVPLLAAEDLPLLERLAFKPRLVEMDGWDEALLAQIRSQWPAALVALRADFTIADDLLGYVDRGVSVFHLTADYHGSGNDGRFVYDLIRAAHNTLVEARVRDRVTLLGSGGIIAAEHVPKAIIAGLDAVALDTSLLVALQAQFDGDFRRREDDNCTLPANLTVDWGVQRLKNMAAAWRDQLLEIMGAMGLREVRRLRGEIGRAMFQKELEREAFMGIHGYDDQK